MRHGLRYRKEPQAGESRPGVQTKNHAKKREGVMFNISASNRKTKVKNALIGGIQGISTAVEKITPLPPWCRKK
jgi:hypothetical protein